MLASVQIYNALQDMFDGRVYPSRVPEGQDDTAPYAVYRRVSNQPTNTYDGYIGHDWVEMQIDIYHTTDYLAEILANRVIFRLESQIPTGMLSGRDQIDDPTTDLYRETVEYGLKQTAQTEN